MAKLCHVPRAIPFKCVSGGRIKFKKTWYDVNLIEVGGWAHQYM